MKTVELLRDAVRIIDQTKLPGRIAYKRLVTREQVYEAIRRLEVRGAPAIGVAAAYGLYLDAKHCTADDYEAFRSRVEETEAYLASARPTAVNLSWALGRMARVVTEREAPVDTLKAQLLSECQAIAEADAHANRMIGEYGLKLLKPGYGILTHCNAGSLATSALGTATAPIYLGQERGYAFRVYCDETRPLLQGARLTALELSQAGVDTTLICDNMAASVMQQGLVQAVFVGCDRVAANGDVANKIGTLGVAILAKYYNIPFYVCAPTSTIDLSCATGRDIVIEQRAPEEVTDMWYKKRMAPEHIQVQNPAFDVTKGSLVTAIITEKGIAYPLYRDSLVNIIHRP